MRSHFIDQFILLRANSRLVVGICGGMQILGIKIMDPLHVESREPIDGLGLLAIRTSMRLSKTTRISSGHLVTPQLFGQSHSISEVNGYEIHIGDTDLKGSIPFAWLKKTGQDEDTFDGCMSSNGNVFGTYFHGLFDDDEFRHTFLKATRTFYDLTPPTLLSNWKERRVAPLDRLAETIRASLDLQRVYEFVGIAERAQQIKERS